MTFTSRRVVLSCALLAAVVVPGLALGAAAMFTDGPEPETAEASSLHVAMRTAVAERSTPSGLEEAFARAASAAADANPPGTATGAASEAAATAAEEPAPSTPAQLPGSAPAIGVPEPNAQAKASVLDQNQMVVFYGTPLASGLGILGMFEPDDAARRVKAQAQIYDKINGDRGAVGAIDVIYGLVQSEPTGNGLYVRYLDDKHIENYLRLAEEHDLQLILDLQIGRGHIPDEVRKIERFLVHPRVHVAIDPEYAVGPNGQPIHTPGRMSGHELNQVQEYVAGIIAAHDLPPKMVVIHQYLDNTIVEGEATRSVENIDLVLNMDAFGPIREKAKKYRTYSSLPWAQRDSFNIFLKQDERVLSEAEVLELTPLPDIVFYQ